jgi:hypothetical protein
VKQIGLCIAAMIALGLAEIMAQSPSPRRDINVVLRTHDKELLAIPGVTGVYVGVLGDGKTACLKVMLVRHNAEAESVLPREIEGYPVITEISGEIRPLGK